MSNLIPQSPAAEARGKIGDLVICHSDFIRVSSFGFRHLIPMTPPRDSAVASKLDINSLDILSSFVIRISSFSRHLPNNFIIWIVNKKYTIKVPIGCVVVVILAFSALSCGRGSDKETGGLIVPDHIGKARALYHQGAYTGAIEMYHKALELEPDNADAYLQLGIIYDDNLKDKEQAVYYYRKFLEYESDSEKSERVRGWIKKSESSIEGGAGDEADASLPEKTIATPPVPVPVISPPATDQAVGPSPGAGITPPVVSTESAPQTIYTVKKGDTLAGIAQKFYGDRTAWKRIYQANRDQLPNPNALKVGQALKIPTGRDRAVIEL